MHRYLARIDAVLIQAVIAGALSFAHLHDLAEAAGQEGWKAWAYPISVDLLLVAAWARLRSGRDVVAGWIWFVIALFASLGANIATAGLLDLDNVPDWLRIVVAGWPAIAFLGGTLLPHSTGSGEQPADEIEFVDEPHEEVPATPISEPATEPAGRTPESLPTGLPAALVEHARKVAAAHQERTGAPIDTETLRARLGVPPDLARQIVTQLA